MALAQVTGLMREVLLFVGLFAVSEPRNQSVLLWGKAPTAVHKLCLLSQSLQDDFQMANSLDCTLLAVCASNHRVCEVNVLLIALVTCPAAAMCAWPTDSAMYACLSGRISCESAVTPASGPMSVFLLRSR